MRRRIKPRITVRVKVRRRKRRRFFSALLAAGLAAAVFYCSGRAWERLSALSGKDFALWRVRSVAVSGVDGRLQKDILASVKFRPGQAWTSGDSVKLAAETASRFPFLAGVKVGRGWLGGRLEVRASLRRAVGRISGDEGVYLGEDGVVFTAPPGIMQGELIAVELPGGGKEGLAGLAGFMKQLMTKADLFTSRPVSVEYFRPGGECVVKFQDGSQARWGDYGFTEEKIARLRQAFADSNSRFQGPVKADLRYFSDGKILLNRMDAAAPRINH